MRYPFTLSRYATKEDLLAAKRQYQGEIEAELRQRLRDGEQGDDIACLMADVFDCDYEAACDAVRAGDPTQTLALLDQALAARHG